MAKKFQVDTNGTLLTNLLSYYKLESDSIDFFGTINGTDTSVSYVAGKVNNAASYNGSTSKSDFGNNFDLTGTEARTWDFWIKPATVTGLKYVFMKGNDVHATHANHGYSFTQNGAGGVFNMNAGGSFQANELQISYASLFTAGTYAHIIITYDGSKTAAGVKLYLNNAVQTPSSTDSDTLTNSITNAVNFMFATSSDGTRFNDMDLDEFAVWSKVISAQERADRYNGGSGQTMVDVIGGGHTMLYMGAG